MIRPPPRMSKRKLTLSVDGGHGGNTNIDLFSAYANTDTAILRKSFSAISIFAITLMREMTED